MIRPFTAICFLMAVGSGLYLYQCKHQAQMLDREIQRTLAATDKSRDKIAMLRTEWTQLNVPQRVADLAQAHTALQTAKPTQFVALGDLASKLPAPAAPRPQGGTTDEPETAAPPLAQATPSPAPEPAALQHALAPAAIATAAPTRPTAATAAAEATRARGDTKPEAPAEPHPVAAADSRPEPRPARPGPRPVQTALANPPRSSEPAHNPARPVADTMASAATAPGTVGAAVLRAMRSRQLGIDAEPVSAPAPRSFAPAPAYVPPPTPVAARPGYAGAYPSSSSGSLLGGAPGALPPPVPFAAR